MAAKSKKRLSKIESKLLKLEKLQLKDVLCSICQSILVEPVTLPCYHDFCKGCFNGTIENNSLCCPLCRLRIGSWLRTSTKQKNLVNMRLWDFIKSKFPQELDVKIRGEDLNLPEETPPIHLSEPGEIRLEYVAEIERLRTERLKLEKKQFEETDLLIKKIQNEEDIVLKKQLERLQQDELLAKQIQQDNIKHSLLPNPSRKLYSHKTIDKPRLKATKIDDFLSKNIVKSTSKQTESSVSTITSSAATVSNVTMKHNNATSPEMVPGYGKGFRKLKNVSSIWNKENGENSKRPDGLQNLEIEKCVKGNVKPKIVQSLPVSLPYTGILRHKLNISDNLNIETDSVDSMRQELCYFKPIDGKTPTSFNTNKGMPLRVPGIRAQHLPESPATMCAPTRAQYLEGLCQLRNISLTKNLPSSFVIALNMLRVKQETTKSETYSRSKIPVSKPTNERKSNTVRKHDKVVDDVSKLNSKMTLRRTRSMGSISKDENETTPKKNKIKQRKVSSERKPYLRSDTRKYHNFNKLSSISESLNNNRVSLVKNLSSPLKNSDVEMILEEQLRIEKMIEQEKNDFELARRVEAEWNGRRQLRRAPLKRQVTLNYALRPAKKLKV